MDKFDQLMEMARINLEEILSELREIESNAGVIECGDDPSGLALPHVVDYFHVLRRIDKLEAAIASLRR